MNTNKNTTTQTAADKRDFEQVKRDFETALENGGDYSPALLDLSTAIAFPLSASALTRNARPPQTVKP